MSRSDRWNFSTDTPISLQRVAIRLVKPLFIETKVNKVFNQPTKAVFSVFSGSDSEGET
jgi:hypothetical protein